MIATICHWTRVAIGLARHRAQRDLGGAGRRFNIWLPLSSVSRVQSEQMWAMDKVVVSFSLFQHFILSSIAQTLSGYQAVTVEENSWNVLKKDNSTLQGKGPMWVWLRHGIVDYKDDKVKNIYCADLRLFTAALFAQKVLHATRFTTMRRPAMKQGMESHCWQRGRAR